MSDTQDEKPLRGRPPTPKDEREAMCRRIIFALENGTPLAEACREPGMPGLRTVYNWIDEDPAFKALIAHARETGEEVIAASCLAIADDAKNDWMKKNGQDSEGYALNGEHVQRSKLRIETRLKLLAKWNPKKWSDRVYHGADTGTIVVTGGLPDDSKSATVEVPREAQEPAK